MDSFKKWDSHKVGETVWINKNLDHPHRQQYIDHILKDDSIKSVLEIGGGELLEAQKILSAKPDLQYTAVDVSTSFLENCRRLSNVKCVEGSMHKLPFEDKQFDIVVLSNVLEHSPDLLKTVDEIKRVSNRYFIIMFKWRMKTGGLTPNYSAKKKYFSTYYNMPSLLQLLTKQSSRICVSAITKSGEHMSYEQYIKTVISPDADDWRNGDRLIIEGEFNE